MTEPHDTYAMADVSGKPVTLRRAIAGGRIRLGPLAYDKVVSRTLPKGDALSLSRFAGILAAKKTPDLIPLCHPISLNRVVFEHALRPESHAIEMFCLAEITERTGVEMEALCGLNIALLTIWDLAKPVEAALLIEDVRLLYKEGGKSGVWIHPGGMPEEATAMLEAASK